MRKKRLYNQTVTLYHPDADRQAVQRTVLHGVYCQCGRRELPHADGARSGAALLLVVPETSARYGVDYTLQPGDRVTPGLGPELTAEAWKRYVPAQENTAVVQYVLPLFAGDVLHHIEAGAWWSGSGTGAQRLTR